VGKGSFDELMSKFDEFLNTSFSKSWDLAFSTRRLLTTPLPLAPNDCASQALNPALVDEKTYEDSMSDELNPEEGQEMSKEMQKTSRQTRLSQWRREQNQRQHWSTDIGNFWPIWCRIPQRGGPAK
jgi:hypothetical protein